MGLYNSPDGTVTLNVRLDLLKIEMYIVMYIISHRGVIRWRR